MKNFSFTAEELRNVISGKCSYERVPMIYDFWIPKDIFGKQETAAREIINKYPSDAQFVMLQLPDASTAPQDDPEYKWIAKQAKEFGTVGKDAMVLVEDWEDLDEIIKHFPNPDYPGMFPDKGTADERYKAAGWWYCFFERLWSLRGMENALTDFYLYPDEVHQLFQKLTDFYIRTIERCKIELNADAIFVSDDIGTQTAPFFSEEIFLEFFKPYYKQLIEKAHSLEMQFWLHTCGNIELYLPHFIEIGLDVIHPIQKYTMNQEEIVQKYGGQICFWAGFDVQLTIPFGTPEEVRKEVRHMIDLYSRKNGLFMLACGNCLTSDCKLESLNALLEESYNYGMLKLSGSI